MQEIHYLPAASLKTGIVQPMPALVDEDLAALKADITLSGIRDAIDFTEHSGRRIVLDGNNRVTIAAELGLDVPARLVQLGDEDPQDYAVRVNMTRRHLDRAQRRDLIKDQLERDPGRSDVLIARITGSSDKTIATVRREMPLGNSEPATDLRKDASGKLQPGHKPRSRNTGTETIAQIRGQRDALQEQLAKRDRDEAETKKARLAFDRSQQAMPGTCAPDWPCQARIAELEAERRMWQERAERARAAYQELQQQLAHFQAAQPELQNSPV